MKFMLFIFPEYEAQGGFSDFVEAMDSKYECIVAKEFYKTQLSALEKSDLIYQIVDIESLDIVEEGRFSDE